MYKRKSNYFCDVCGKDFYLRPSTKKKSKTYCCSSECSAKMRSIIKRKELEEKLGIDNFEYWLREKYEKELLTIRKISNLIYGHNRNSSTVLKWLHEYGIEVRTGSEAVKTQWINADERKEASRQIAYKYLQTKDSRDSLREVMQTDEYKQKQSVTKKGERNGMWNVTGEQHPNWNPERTKEQRIAERKTEKDSRWRKDIFNRDKYICQCCGYDKGHILVAHHMNSWHWCVEGRYDVNNGITLCEPCHKRFHKEYGIKNNTKEQMNAFLEKYNKQIV